MKLEALLLVRLVEQLLQIIAGKDATIHLFVIRQQIMEGEHAHLGNNVGQVAGGGESEMDGAFPGQLLLLVNQQR